MELDIPGAFLDTTGSTKTDKLKSEDIDSSGNDSQPILYDTHFRDEVEERLESLVFGSQSFTGRALPESDNELEDGLVKEVTDDVGWVVIHETTMRNI